ncbi:hypothetical protein [Nonomuraea sp. NPDC005650]|uniref:hypothetical protein n=1 Tax=Nonomuraea sp. NPDC005650 TaxID=3157045 RepID=UPI0033A52653
MTSETTPSCWCADPGRTDDEMYQCPAGDAGEDCLAHDYLATGGALSLRSLGRYPLPPLSDFANAARAAQTTRLDELRVDLCARFTPAFRQLGAALHGIGSAVAHLLNAWHHPTPRRHRAYLKERDRLARDQRNTRWPHATHAKTAYHRRRR